MLWGFVLHRAVGGCFNFIGGAIGRMAGTGLAVGIFFVLVGVTPWQFAAELIARPPSWSTSAWFRDVIVILGLAVIWASLTFNRWSTKQKVIDELADDISWAIDNLLNRKPQSVGADFDPQYINVWERDFTSWCTRVSQKLSNRAFFTRADQLHFDYLGFVDPITFHQNPRMNKLLSELRMKIGRLRDVINWTQERRR